eukprot:976748_1
MAHSFDQNHQKGNNVMIYMKDMKLAAKPPKPHDHKNFPSDYHMMESDNLQGYAKIGCKTFCAISVKQYETYGEKAVNAMKDLQELVKAAMNNNELHKLIVNRMYHWFNNNEADSYFTYEQINVHVVYNPQEQCIFMKEHKERKLYKSKLYAIAGGGVATLGAISWVKG